MNSVEKTTTADNMTAIPRQHEREEIEKNLHIRESGSGYCCKGSSSRDTCVIMDVESIITMS